MAPPSEDARTALKMTSLPQGLRLAFWGLELFALVLLLPSLYLLFGEADPGIFNRLERWVPLAHMAACAFALSGRLLCWPAVRRLKNPGSLGAAIALEGLAALLVLWGYALPLRYPLAAVPVPAGLIGAVCFLYFLQELAGVLGEEALSKSAGVSGKVGMGLVALVLALGALHLTYIPFGFVFLYLALLVGLVLLVRYTVLLVRFCRLLARP